MNSFHVRLPNRTAHVLLDESGQQLPNRPVLVGAAVTYDLASLESGTAELWEMAIASRRVRGLPSFDALIQEGFHNGQIPPETEFAFIDALTKLDGFRLFIAMSNRKRLPKLSDDERCLVLYSTLLRDLIPHVKASNVDLLFEQNTALNPFFERVASDARQRAAVRTPNKDLPDINTKVVTKDDYRALGIVDFALSIVSHWIASGTTRDPSKYQYRNFLAIERDLAVIYDFDTSKRSTRESRDFRR